MTSTGTLGWPTFAREIGIRLSRRRHDLGLSQERVAHLAGVTRYHYQQLEKGESRPGTPANPALITMLAIAQALELDVSDLLRDPPDLRVE